MLLFYVRNSQQYLYNSKIEEMNKANTRITISVEHCRRMLFPFETVHLTNLRVCIREGTHRITHTLRWVPSLRHTYTHTHTLTHVRGHPSFNIITFNLPIYNSIILNKCNTSIPKLNSIWHMNIVSSTKFNKRKCFIQSFKFDNDIKV